MDKLMVVNSSRVQSLSLFGIKSNSACTGWFNGRSQDHSDCNEQKKKDFLFIKSNNGYIFL